MPNENLPVLAPEDESMRAVRLAYSDDSAPRLYPLLTPEQMAAKPLPRWRVRGLIPETGVGMLFGESGSLKSYLALDLGYAVADGRDWFGMRVNAAPVVYVCLEGNAGFGMRVRAIESEQPGLRPSLRFMDGGVFALDMPGDVQRLAQSIKAARCVPGTLVIIDTLACASGEADENSTKDARKLIQAAKQLAAYVEGFVLLVHHTGKNTTNGPRGGSNFRADTDVVIQVVKASDESNGIGYWTSTKVKDAKDGGRFGFEMKWISLGCDDDGQEVVCGVVVPTDAPVVLLADDGSRAAGRPPGTGKNQTLVFDAIKAAMKVDGRQQLHYTRVMSAAISALRDKGIDRPGERAKDIIRSLLKSRRLLQSDDLLWIGENGNEEGPE